MIKTVAEFLEKFKSYALEKVETEDSDINHRPTIGNIFEGVTSELLSQAIFDNLNLQLVQNSFIYNDSGQISDEMDCMLVVGNGIKINFTNQYKYHVRDVIAVIQVKKTLYARDFEESYQNLKSVQKISEPRDAEPFVNIMQRNAYRILTGQEIPKREDLDNLTERENIIYHYLLMEAFYPLRIVIGYYGYTSEFNLREGIVNKLEEMLKDGPVRGYSPGSFPSLLICGDNTVIKNNGMPKGVPLSKEDEFYFHAITTSNSKPMYHLLDLVWTRLSFKFDLNSNIFGDDFDIEPTHPFLSCKERIVQKKPCGWDFYYHSFTKEQLSPALISERWKPAEIDKIKFTILSSLLNVGSINFREDEELIKYSKKENFNIDTVIGELCEERLIYKKEESISILVDELMMSFTPDGKVLAGENISGQMRNYMIKEYGK